MSKNFRNLIHVGHIKVARKIKNGIGVYKSGLGRVFGLKTTRSTNTNTIFGIKINPKNHKVFCIGLGKTGTTSLFVALREIGFNHHTYCVETLKAYSNNDLDYVFDKIRCFDSFDDFPWPLLYKTLYEKWPNAKFILTLRKDPETWYNSLKKHFLHASENGGDETVEFQIAPWVSIYGKYNIVHDRVELMDYYLTHQKEVIEFFADKPGKLLTVCWENGDGYNEICHFLDLPKPELDFPVTNTTQNRN